MIKKYTDEEREWLKQNSSLYSRKELTDLYNSIFKENRTIAAIHTYCKKHGFKASTDGRFKLGNKTWNTGMTKEEHKAHFSKESYSSLMKSLANGREKHKVGDKYLMKIGNERIPYIIISTDYSIPFKKRIVPETRYVLQQHGIEVPDGYSVIHLDGNSMNNDFLNLKVVSNREKVIVVNNHWFDNKELIETGLMYAKLYTILSDHKKEVEDDL